MIDLRNDQKVFVEEAYKHFNKDILTRGEINSFVKKSGLKNPSCHINIYQFNFHVPLKA